MMTKQKGVRFIKKISGCPGNFEPQITPQARQHHRYRGRGGEGGRGRGDEGPFPAPVNFLMLRPHYRTAQQELDQNSEHIGHAELVDDVDTACRMQRCMQLPRRQAPAGLHPRNLFCRQDNLSLFLPTISSLGPLPPLCR